MTPGDLLTPDEAKAASACGIGVRPWFGATDGHESHVITTASANAIARFGAYRIAMAAVLAKQEPERAEEAKVMALAETARMVRGITAAVGRGEL